MYPSARAREAPAGGGNMDAEIRELETLASSQGDASSWSRLASALARAGRGPEAYTAAVRATARDPGDPSRALLAPRTNGVWPGPQEGVGRDTIPWRGLRSLGRVRVIAAG